MAESACVNPPLEHRYEIRDTEHRLLGHIEYLERDGLTVLPHTEIDPSLRGGGQAGALVRFALDDLRSKGVKVRPTCPYVERWMDRHPEYDDLRHRP